MGVDVHDDRDRSRFIHANWWQWRPTVELIRSFEIFNGERLDLLSEGFGEFTEHEARQLGGKLEAIITGLQPDQRILLDGTITARPDDGTFYRASDEQHRNYSADYAWLLRFAEFCSTAGGLYVC